MRTEWAVISHTSQEKQSEVGHLSFLETYAVEDDLSQCQKCGVSSKARVKQSFEIQNNLRFRVRKEEPKKAQLRDTNSGSHGPHLECVVTHCPCPIHGVSEGLCLISYREQIVRPIVRNSQTAQRAKRKGMFAEKTKGMANPSCAMPQESEVIAIEERGFQEMIPTQTPGCSEDNKTKRGWSREERGIPKDIEEVKHKKREASPALRNGTRPLVRFREKPRQL